MRTSLHARSWATVHRWTSLVCAGFLLIICVTGLRLVFSDQISQWEEPYVVYS
ncbi:hypothetical protein CAL29_23505 [Bordetella genomosp. 10]|uniref:Peptidase n=1 Tax=Bordetella genomosp. 10 TaxID=1416804 RepID=A0A261S527_9BORD|nr:PepSY domain-containing protein [Bordetella genomosp. 10]OZI32446.1 hypothetical protein CAL29_23505 [Bordetella genomosp. 10]